VNTYEWALRTAGFTSVAWHALIVPPEVPTGEGPTFWTDLVEGAPITLIDCDL
jgi:hypothetical protein